MRWAVALVQLGKLDQARKAARSAIERGARGGFVRSLHVPGFDVTWMFADVWTERPEFSRVRNALQEVIARSPEAPATVLTRREREVLALVAQGWSNQQIADGMYISINTVRNHLVKICRRLGAGSRMEAVIRAREAGILD
jgi:DNA-binding NarL/FixJ family response regulator